MLHNEVSSKSVCDISLGWGKLLAIFNLNFGPHDIKKWCVYHSVQLKCCLCTYNYSTCYSLQFDMLHDYIH